jgi:hypothetical protein
MMRVTPSGGFDFAGTGRSKVMMFGPPASATLAIRSTVGVAIYTPGHTQVLVCDGGTAVYCKMRSRF